MHVALQPVFVDLRWFGEMGFGNFRWLSHFTVILKV